MVDSMTTIVPCVGEPRIGADPITAADYTDPDGISGSSERLTAINGLGQVLDLGQVSLGAVEGIREIRSCRAGFEKV